MAETHSPLAAPLPYKISVLVYLRDTEGRLLLMRRRKSPNFGLWSSIGGKLEMATGESPHQCAIRESFEETGLLLRPDELHCFGMIAEKAYEGRVHFLMFLFDCRRELTELPPPIDEGDFAFHAPGDVMALPMPETDRVALWPLYFGNRTGFTTLSADCTPGTPLEVVVEQGSLTA